VGRGVVCSVEHLFLLFLMLSNNEHHQASWGSRSITLAELKIYFFGLGEPHRSLGYTSSSPEPFPFVFGLWFDKKQTYAQIDKVVS
jgi:hypothetical protein